MKITLETDGERDEKLVENVLVIIRDLNATANRVGSGLSSYLRGARLHGNVMANDPVGISREAFLNAQPDPNEPTPEEVDVVLDALGSDLKENAEEMLRAEVGEMLLLGGNVKRIKERLDKGKKVKLKRKKGCIYLQIGEGTGDDPIEEIPIITHF